MATNADRLYDVQLEGGRFGVGDEIETYLDADPTAAWNEIIEQARREWGHDVRVISVTLARV